MKSWIVQAESLGKCFIIQHQIESRSQYRRLSEEIVDRCRRPIERLLKIGRERSEIAFDVRPVRTEQFWALRDVFLEIAAGDTLGIIGRNGAGKSTLLKVLSRITEPTEGRVRIRGRVASLLEVGTGFHPELTGRENIFLNGTILGMTRREIQSKFDEIVAFAEIENFLDTPVKRYSSGMYVRLAFAVAAHIEPDVLIVDEVLAVGDSQFQKKCIGKMQEVAGQQGRTVLFVSHNMAAVQTLCRKAALLKGGQLQAYGEASDVVGKYILETASVGGGGRRGPHARLGKNIVLEDIRFSPSPIISGQNAEFEFGLSCEHKETIQQFSLLVYSSRGSRVAILDLRGSIFPAQIGPEIGMRVVGRISGIPLVEGEYGIGVWIVTDSHAGEALDLVSLKVMERADASDLVPYPAEYRGVINLSFEVERQNKMKPAQRKSD